MRVTVEGHVVAPVKIETDPKWGPQVSGTLFIRDEAGNASTVDYVGNPTNGAGGLDKLADMTPITAVLAITAIPKGRGAALFCRLLSYTARKSR